MKTRTMKNLYAFIALVAALLRLEPCAFAQNPGPGPLTITVSTATPTDDPNYYLVEVGDDGDPATTIQITGVGDIPSLQSDMLCTCGYNGQTAAPDTDGNRVYTFENDEGVGDQDDNGVGPDIFWDVDSNTTPNEYKFALQDITQFYLSCTGSWTNGSTTATQENSQASPTITILAYKITTTCDADIPVDKTRTTIGVGEDVTATILPASVVAQWTLSNDPDGSHTDNGSTYSFHGADNSGSLDVSAAIHGVTKTLTFTIVAPNGENAWITGGDGYYNDEAGCGMEFQVCTWPTDVSLHNVEILELTCPAVTDGYFNTRVSSHHPNVPIQLTNLNYSSDHSGTGTGFNNAAKFKPWAWGTYSYDIPLRWKSLYQSGTPQDPTLWGYSFSSNRFSGTVMTGTNGEVIHGKFGQSGSRTPTP